MKDKSSEELIEVIKKKDDPKRYKQAEEAFREFTYRYQIDLMKKLIPICKSWGYNAQVANDIAYLTFERVWKYTKYDSSRTNQDEIDNRVLFYLFGIAKRRLVEYKKKDNGDDINPFSGDEKIIYNFPSLDSLDTSIEKKAELERYYTLIKEALDELSQKHITIYLTYKQYESETNDGYKLPRKLLLKLREELNISQSTIRSYKKEAYEAVIRKLESNEKEQEEI